MKRRCVILTFLLVFLVTTIAIAQLDFGDAPDPGYPTLTINGGANHVVGPLFLGNQVDIEFNGQPGFFARGDDTNGIPDDEDGIWFSTWLVPGQNATLVVTASMTGFLDAWIDFQANGNWTDPGDQVFTNQMILGGQNSLVFAVPATANAGYTYGRFRFSSTGLLMPTGIAPDGEVEDYRIVIGAPASGLTVMDPDAGLSFTQNEISMAVVPGSGNLVAVYNDEPFPGGPGIGVSISTDNGVTWTSQQLAVPNNPFAAGTFLDAFDPSVAADNAGNIFAAHIATDFNWATGPASGLFVHKSSNGGTSWNTPVIVDTAAGAIGSPDPNYRFNDRCQIRVDQTSSSPYTNNIYVAWLQDRGWNSILPYSDIYVSVSTDGGNNFSTAQQINATANDLGNLPIQAIAPNGDLYVLWMDYNVITGGSGVMLLDKSTDGGVNWGTDVVVDTILLPPLNLNSGSDARAKGAAILRTNPSNSSHLYIVYAADPDTLGPDEADIFFIKSTNGGTTWSTRLKLNDDATTNDQVLPWMEVTPSGIIDVVWYDRRNDPGDLLWDVYVTTSTNGGTSFSVNAQVNAASFATPQTTAGPWYGEYLALAVTNTTAYIGFTSSSIDNQGDVLFDTYSNPSTLPIEAFNFEAIVLQNQAVGLSWQTESETNTDYFTVERKRNTTNWEAVRTLKAAGNSSVLSTYNTVDKMPYSGVSYYRLMQTDLNGQYVYSPAQEINIQPLTDILIYPNPVFDEIYVDAGNHTDVHIQLFDNTGRLLLSKKASKRIVPLEFHKYLPGIYLIKVSTHEKVVTRKVVKY